MFVTASRYRVYIVVGCDTTPVLSVRYQDKRLGLRRNSAIPHNLNVRLLNGRKNWERVWVHWQQVRWRQTFRFCCFSQFHCVKGIYFTVTLSVDFYGIWVPREGGFYVWFRTSGYLNSKRTQKKIKVDRNEIAAHAFVFSITKKIYSNWLPYNTTILAISKLKKWKKLRLLLQSDTKKKNKQTWFYFKRRT